MIGPVQYMKIIYVENGKAFYFQSDTDIPLTFYLDNRVSVKVRNKILDKTAIQKLYISSRLPLSTAVS